MDITSVVRAALASYLRTALPGVLAGVEVSEVWPTPGKPLPALAVTVLVAGDPEVRFHPPRIYRAIPGVAPNGTVRYSYGRANVPLQLDAWATFGPTLSTLTTALEAVLHRAPGETLSAPTAPRLRRRGGLVLEPAALLGAPCAFRFQAAPTPAESSDTAQQGEWRATWSGSAETWIVSEEQLALLQSIAVQVPAGSGLDPFSLT